MSDALSALETQRAALQRQIGQLGDMRAGSISTTGGRCGNTRCHCHEEGDPGHGPFFRLTRKIGGKTVTEHSPLQQACAKHNTRWRNITVSVNSATVCWK